MSRLPTSRDVARLAGVSQSTVSFVINDSRAVSPSARERVLAAVDQLGYQPNSGARALKNRKSRLLALVAPHRPGQDAAGQMRYVDAIARACRRRDYDMMLVTADEGPEGVIRVARTALCDAVLVMEVQSKELRTEALSRIRIPSVMIGVPDDHADVTCIDFDFETAGAGCATILSQAGHERIGLVTEANPTIAAAAYTHHFARGVDRAVKELGLTKLRIQARGGAFGADQAVRNAIHADTTALIASPPFPLADLLHAMTLNGLRPGLDSSAISFTEAADLDSSEIRPTYFSLNREEAADTVVEMALAAVAGRSDAPVPGAVRLVAPTLVRGDSVRPSGG